MILYKSLPYLVYIYIYIYIYMIYKFRYSEKLHKYFINIREAITITEALGGV
jgi:hypothetical protein